jgi:hypothetical protein
MLGKSEVSGSHIIFEFHSMSLFFPSLQGPKSLSPCFYHLTYPPLTPNHRGIIDYHTRPDNDKLTFGEALPSHDYAALNDRPDTHSQVAPGAILADNPHMGGRWAVRQESRGSSLRKNGRGLLGANSMKNFNVSPPAIREAHLQLPLPTNMKENLQAIQPLKIQTCPPLRQCQFSHQIASAQWLASRVQTYHLLPRLSHQTPPAQ